jgi:polysaccharide biosynthesis transport protein
MPDVTANTQPIEFSGVSARQTAAQVPMVLRYFQIALRRRWLIASIIAGSMIVALITTLLLTPQYTSLARLEIRRDQQNITNTQGLESEKAGEDLEFYQTQYALLSARSLAERVARSLRLATNDEFFAAHGVDPNRGASALGSRSVRLNASQRNQREALAVETLLDNVVIAPVRGSALVDVVYSSGSPQLSSTIANKWTSEFIAESIARRFSSTADARRFLEGRLVELRTRLEESERAAVAYASRQGIVALNESNARWPRPIWKH